MRKLTSAEAEAVLADPDRLAAMIAEDHVERYPEGCRSPGHHCEACTKRLDDRPHAHVKVGARRGYLGSWVCNEPRCPYYRS